MPTLLSGTDVYLTVDTVEAYIRKLKAKYTDDQLGFHTFEVLERRLKEGYSPRNDNIPEQSHSEYLKELNSLVSKVKNVVGGFQEECQPGDDPGNDEDGARGADERSGLRSGREVQT